MKKVSKITIIILLFLGFNTYAQSNSKLKTEAEKSNVERHSKQPAKNESKPAGSTETKAVIQLDENDIYQGRKQEFENLFLAKKLPADFPVYHKSYGVKGYNQMIHSYCTNHLDLLNQQVKAKIQGHQ